MSAADARARAVALVTLAPFYERLRARVEGLTDHEYLWEPVPGCLTVEAGSRGPFSTGGPAEGGRFTTIAWRLCHIGDFLRDERNARWLGREPAVRNDDIRHPTTAAGGVDYLEQSWRVWDDLLSSLSVEELWERLGPIAGPYGDGERIGYVIHIMDELIHHGAEVGVVRDLYAAVGGREPVGDRQGPAS